MYSKQLIIPLPSFSPIHFLFCTFVILLASTPISHSYDGNETDHHALLKIKLMITQDPYGTLTSWKSSLHFCDWVGVTCGKKHKRVTRIVLESLGLEGLLSPHVGNLSFLQELQLTNNSFHGAIPNELGRLSRLRFLRMNLNKFNGFIPTNISSCFNLEHIRLSHNELVGSIPEEITFLSKLTILTLSRNYLTGGIPQFLGNITSMEVFYVAENPLGGSIPEIIGNWKELREFGSHACNLSGTIPNSLYNLSLLTDILLAKNQLSGSLPSTIMFPHLVIFQLWGNQLTGPLPPSISNCSKLKVLEMTENKFSGKVTIDFTKLSNIYWILLGDNLFGSKEADDMKFIDSMKNCTRLNELNIGGNKFQGVLPRSIGNLSNQLQYLTLGMNYFHGNIPTSIGNLASLSLLVLGRNQLTGNIPSTIGTLQNLGVLQLQENKLSGPIPDAVGNLSMLLFLSLGFNTLEGHIPSSLGQCRRLSELFLNDNKLHSIIPTQLFQISSLSKTLDLSRNKLVGSLPNEVGDLKTLHALDLSYNSLSGNIPSRLGDCVSLSSLSLEGNSFEGIIPQSLSSLKALVELDVSQNNLSGQIPQFFKGFSSLEYLNLSYNDFEGEVPTQGVFTNSSAYSILGNSRLCSDLVELGLPKCKETNKHKKKLPMFVIVIMIASIVFAITCLAYAWSKKKRKSRSSQVSKSKQIMKVSYNQLLKATNGFSEANLIGNGGYGSVYKGILDEDEGKFVAVKVLDLQNQGAQRSFMKECEAWRNIRHRNLLKIITSCSSIDFQGNDFKALVYEFMSNGSLHDWLHSSDGTHSLNLLQRINILLDIACALDYIHNCSIPSLVHGDLKPSNILLDDDMVAHVGDFGLARFLGTTSYQNNSTGIRGTIGYVAPEYCLGNEMTCSGDVYSFGILVLEVMTGKKPTDDIFIEGNNLHNFASMALEDHVTNVVDSKILYIYQEIETVRQNTEAKFIKIEESMASVVKIGVSCSLDSPTQRMEINHVVRELKKIQDTLKSI